MFLTDEETIEYLYLSLGIDNNKQNKNKPNDDNDNSTNTESATHVIKVNIRKKNKFSRNYRPLSMVGSCRPKKKHDR